MEDFKQYRIGIDLGGTHVQVVILNEVTNTIVADFEQDFDGSNGFDIKKVEDTLEMKRIILKIILELIGKSIQFVDISLSEIHFIGIGAPGVCKNNQILELTNLGGAFWDIALELQSKLKLQVPIQVDNDAVCAIGGEHISQITLMNHDIKEGAFAKIRGRRGYLGFGTGLASGGVLGNEIQPAEFGHIIVDYKSDVTCGCGGKGHLESLCSMKRFRQKVAKKLNTDMISGRDLTYLIEQKDRRIYPLYMSYLEYVAVAIAQMKVVYKNPAICIGGSLAYMINKEDLVYVEERVKELTPVLKKEKQNQIIISELVGLAQIVGAAYLDKISELIQ